ncbi:hypothetical protein FB45DRAFT_870454 [Roridomyces roridus]|uniref:Uncharacterized protein n=1 Tax=Roridomyces roridus TaxID=1738132 RepID=A0AAD7FG81_9AGAR|nr:hypothetical protein FB45DRAFT_870454 [Roridomyces roridus]
MCNELEEEYEGRDLQSNESELRATGILNTARSGVQTEKPIVFAERKLNDGANLGHTYVKFQNFKYEWKMSCRWTTRTVWVFLAVGMLRRSPAQSWQQLFHVLGQIPITLPPLPNSFDNDTYDDHWYENEDDDRWSPPVSLTHPTGVDVVGVKAADLDEAGVLETQLLGHLPHYCLHPLLPLTLSGVRSRTAIILGAMGVGACIRLWYRTEYS